MIVHLVSPDTRASGGTFLKMKGTVLDKIRADYNTEKRDRFVFLLTTHSHEL
jgi:trafficking protein particle complex subunit 10